MTINDLYPSESTWSISQGENEGLPLILRTNTAAATLIGHPDFGLRVGVAVPFQEPTETGFPSKEELEELEAIEDLLMAHLEAGQQGILVFVVTTGNMREFVFYAHDEEAVDAALIKASSEIPSHELQSYIEEDPEWSLYQELTSDLD